MSVIRNGTYQENIPFVKTIHMYVFIKGIIMKTNCYWQARFSSICIKGVSLKRGFGGCDGLGGNDGFNGLGGFGGFDGLGAFGGFSGFDGFSGFGGFAGFVF